MIFQEIKNGNWAAIALLPKLVQVSILSVFALFVGGVSILAYLYVFNDNQFVQFDNLVLEEKSLLKELGKLQTVQNTAAEYAQQKTEAEALLDEVRQRLPTAIEMNSFNNDLNLIANKNGVVVNRYVKQADSKVDDFIFSASVQLSGCASYHGFASFIGELSELDRIITLGEITISNNRFELAANQYTSVPCGSFSATHFPFTAVLSTYRYAEKG